MMLAAERSATITEVVTVPSGLAPAMPPPLSDTGQVPPAASVRWRTTIALVAKSLALSAMVLFAVELLQERVPTVSVLAAFFTEAPHVRSNALDSRCLATATEPAMSAVFAPATATVPTDIGTLPPVAKLAYQRTVGLAALKRAPSMAPATCAAT